MRLTDQNRDEKNNFLCNLNIIYKNWPWRTWRKLYIEKGPSRRILQMHKGEDLPRATIYHRLKWNLQVVEQYICKLSLPRSSIRGE